MKYIQAGTEVYKSRSSSLDRVLL